MVATMRHSQASLFGCDGTLLMSVGEVLRFGDMYSVEIAEAPPALPAPIQGKPLFARAWDAVAQLGEFRKYDWFVKLDLSTVFFPSRLRERLLPITPRIGSKHLLVGTCAPEVHVIAHTNLHSSMEVVSRASMELYATKKELCNSTIQQPFLTEEVFLESCMRRLGARQVDRGSMTVGPQCAVAPCSDTTKVAFTGFSGISSYFACWSESRHAAAKSPPLDTN